MLEFVDINYIDEDKWKPCEADFEAYLKEKYDELEYYKDRKNETYDGHNESLLKEISEFQEADFDKRVKLIKSHIFCYARCTPTECFTPLWRRVLGLDD